MKQIFTGYMLIGVFIFLNTNSFSQWLTDPAKNPICTATDAQNSPSIVSDGNDGAIITWCDYRSGNSDIYAQRISASGEIQWTLNGVAVCNEVSAQYDPLAVADGSGGAIIVWEDQRNGNFNIYAQRIDADGLVHTGWTANGVAIRNRTDNIARPGEVAIVSDGSGGAIITWTDRRNYYDIYAAKVLSDGSVPWTTDGVVICSDLNYSLTTPAITSDGSGGAIIAWTDYRQGPGYSHNIYAQRIDLNGSTVWIDNGKAVCSANETQAQPSLVSDGSHGAFITWEDHRTTPDYEDIYAKRIDANGDTYTGWPTDGLAVCTEIRNQQLPKLINDGNGGIIITWYDYRTGYDGSHNDIYAQRINGDGTIYTGWQAGGEAVCTASGNQADPQIVSDGSNGAIIAWHDNRSGPSDIYTRRINLDGDVQWTDNGVAISTLGDDQYNTKLVSDGNGGAIITWYSEDGDGNIYASQIDGSGGIGTLPVELVSFTALFFNNEVELNWQTATEVNNYGFEVERRSNLQGQGMAFSNSDLEGYTGSWEKIGFMEGNGNSNSQKDYSFVDESVGTRLKV